MELHSAGQMPSDQEWLEALSDALLKGDTIPVLTFTPRRKLRNNVVGRGKEQA